MKRLTDGLILHSILQSTPLRHYPQQTYHRAENDKLLCDVANFHCSKCFKKLQLIYIHLCPPQINHISSLISGSLQVITTITSIKNSSQVDITQYSIICAEAAGAPMNALIHLCLKHWDGIDRKEKWAGTCETCCDQLIKPPETRLKDQFGVFIKGHASEIAVTPGRLQKGANPHRVPNDKTLQH